MRTVVKFMGLIVLVAGVWHAKPLQAQQIDFYPANPWLTGSKQGESIQTSGAPHPNTLPAPPIGFGGLFTVPQSLAMGQGIFDQDGVMDAIGAPGQGENHLGNCFGDLKSSVNLLAAALVPTCINGKCNSKCTEVPIEKLPAETKAICDKGCQKVVPLECLENCDEEALSLKNSELGKCVTALKQEKPGVFDGCLDQCVADALAPLEQCKIDNGCNNKPTVGEQKECNNNCFEAQLNNTNSCLLKCVTDPKEACSKKCGDDADVDLNNCVQNACKDVDGNPGQDDPAGCEKCINDLNAKYFTCSEKCKNDFQVPQDNLQKCFNDAETKANVKNNDCQAQAKCFDQPITDYKTQCYSININSVDCLSMLTKEEVQQCVLTPMGEGGPKTLVSGDVPESCKGEVQGAILQNDGDHDIADTLLEDKWGPDADSILVAEHIPDPVDSAFPTVSQKNQLFLPIGVTTGPFDFADPAPETVVLNAFPLNPDALSQMAAKMKSGDKNEQLEFLKQISPMPLPSFLSDPKFQSKAPLFMFLRDGLAEPEYNFDNECNTDKAKSPRNCLSTPVAVQPVSVSGSGADDLAILHQFFSTPTEDIDPKKAMFGGWDQNPIGALLKPLLTNLLSPSLLGKKAALDYCSNLTAEGLLPGQLPGNESSQAINVGYLGIGFNSLGGTYSGWKLETPIANEIVGYLTLHTNDGQGHFSKWPSAGAPYRFCVGKTPVGFAKINSDGLSAGANDLAVANFGGISSQDPLNPHIASMTFEVAGGVTFIHNYEGGKNKQEEILNLPIRTAGEDHPLHPNSIACGDINGDGYDDCIATFMDAIGMRLNLVSQTNYRVPDVIATAKGLAPDFGGKCNGKDFPLPNDPKPWACPSVNGIAVYQDLVNFNDNNWFCTKVMTPKNPINVSDPGATAAYDLYQCQGGQANDPTCGMPFTKKYASSFVYKVNYKVTYEPPINVPPGQVIKASGFPPQVWNCTQDAGDPKKSGVFSWQCSLPDSINLQKVLQSWRCSYTDQPLILNDPAKNQDPNVAEVFQQDGQTYTETDMNSGVFVAPTDGLPDGDLISCEGVTANQGNGMALALPNPLLSALIPFVDDVTKAPLGTIAYQGPVQRDAVYSCNSGVPINRNSELAVYMNRGANVPFAQQFTNDPEFHQYVNMAAFNVPPIVADFPVDLASESSPTLLNKDKMSVTNKISAKGSKPGNFVGLGVWPSHAALADLVDKNGAPLPNGDGCADAIIALNNSFHVALIPSQACKKVAGQPGSGQPGKYEQDKIIQQPFQGAPTLFFDSTTPKFKHDMVEFIKGPLQKLKDQQPLDAADKLTLGIALMSGTSYVSVPEQPLTGQREFSDLPPQRGIVAIHGFPWRFLLTSMNSAEFPASMIEGMMKSLGSKFKGLFGALPGMGGPGGGAPGCANLPGGKGGCTLIPTPIPPVQCLGGGS